VDYEDLLELLVTMETPALLVLKVRSVSPAQPATMAVLGLPDKQDFPASTVCKVRKEIPVVLVSKVLLVLPACQVS